MKRLYVLFIFTCIASTLGSEVWGQEKDIAEWTGRASGITEQRFVVVGGTAAWTQLWREHSEKDGDAPPVDFDRFLIVGVFNPKGIKTGMRIDRISKGILRSDHHHYNVFIVSDESGNVFHLRRIPHTRLGFNFYMQGVDPNVGKAKRVKSLDSPLTVSPAKIDKETRDAVGRLLRKLEGGDESAGEALLKYGERIRSFLNQIITNDRHAELWWKVDRVLEELDKRAVLSDSPVNLSEVAVGKAIAAVKENVRYSQEPWYTKQSAHRDGADWVVNLYGTWSVFSFGDAWNQADVQATVRISADKGKILECKIQRPDQNLKATSKSIEQSAPGVQKAEE